MDEVLEYLKNLLVDNLKDLNIQRVEIMSEFEEHQLGRLMVDQFPCVLIEPMGEDWSPGPSAEMATKTFEIRFKIKMTYAELNQARTGKKNIFKVSYRIIDLIVKDKMLGETADRTQLSFRSTDYDDYNKIFPQGYAVARDLDVRIDQFVEWIGTANPQEDGITRSV